MKASGGSPPPVTEQWSKRDQMKVQVSTQQLCFSPGSRWGVPPKVKPSQFFPQEGKTIFQSLRLEDY